MAEATPSELPILALDTLRVAVGGDAAALRALLGSWLSENEADLDALRARLSGRDAEGARATAHRMKGAARMVGALAYAEACLGVERLARAGDFAALEAAEAELREQLGAAEAMVEAMLDGP